MFSFPARLYRKFGHWLIYPLALLTLLSIIPITRTEVASGFTFLLPEKDPYRIQQLQVRELFGTNESIIIALDVPELFRAEDLERIQQIEELATGLTGTAYVLSLTSMPDLYLEDDALIERPLYSPETDPNLEELRRRVLGTPLFRDFFISSDGKAIFTYVMPNDDVKPTAFVERLIDTLGEDGLHYFGDAVIETYVSHTVTRELAVLGTLALLVIMLIEMVITRSVLVGAVLTLVSAVPAIWTLALFPLLGQAVETTTMMVPVIVLVLATSYGVHLFRYHASHGANIVDTLEQVSKVVISAGVSTMVGFLSLVVTPSAVLRQLGWLIIFGILAALVSSLLLFPPILAGLPVKRSRKRQIRRKPDGNGYRGRFGLLWTLGREPRRPGIRILIFIAVLVPFAAAIPSIRAGYSARDTVRSGSTVAETVDYFVERSQSNQQIQIVFDTGVEYGLVDLQTYNELKAVEQMLDDDEAIQLSTSYIDFVEWMNGRLEGRIEPVAPQSDAEIGETMELLSGEGIEDLFDAVVDVDWRQARFLMQVSLPNLSSPKGAVAIEELAIRVDGYRNALSSGIDVALLGEPFANLKYSEYLARSQYISVIVFLPILLAFLLFVFRSVGWSLITLIPTFAGIIV